MFWRARLANYFFSALVVFSAAGVTYLYMRLYEREGAARIIEAVGITGVAPTYNMKPGSPVKIAMSSRLHSICPFEFQWSLVRLSDHVETVKVVEPVHDAARDVILTAHSIPANTVPGGYTFSVQIYDQCPTHTYFSQRSIEMSVGQP